MHFYVILIISNNVFFMINIPIYCCFFIYIVNTSSYIIQKCYLVYTQNMCSTNLKYKYVTNVFSKYQFIIICNVLLK